MQFIRGVNATLDSSVCQMRKLMIFFKAIEPFLISKINFLGLCDDMGTETHQSEPKEVGELLNNKIIAIDANADQSFAVTSKQFPII